MTDETPAAGHNSGIAVEQLASFARRLRKLEDDKKEAMSEFTDDIRELKAEAKGNGFDTKLLAKAVQMQRLEDDERAILGLYCNALNVFD